MELGARATHLRSPSPGSNTRREKALAEEFTRASLLISSKCFKGVSQSRYLGKDKECPEEKETASHQQKKDRKC